MSKAKKHLDNYQKFLIKGQIPKAIDALEQVVQLMPKDINHRKKLADLYFRAKRNAEAFSSYETVARSFAEGGFYLKAIAVYRQMQKIDPTQPAVYEQLADLNQKQGLMGQALSEYGELVTILEKAERYTEAAEVLAKMAKLDPSNLGVRIRVAESFCRSGDKEKGLEELNEISKELRKKGDMATLRKLYELFMRQFPEDLSIQAGMARSLISSGDPARALQLLQGLLKKAPDNVDILGNLANAYRATKDHENERLTFKQLIKQTPDFLDFHKGYARACLDAGAPDKALDHLEQCKQMFADPTQQKALVSYYEKLNEALAGDARVVAALRELYTATGQKSKLADLDSQAGLLADEGFAGFDQGVEELEPLEEVEELEPLEDVEELEPLEEVEEFEELEEMDEFGSMEEPDILAAGGDEAADDFAADTQDFSDADDLLGGDGDDFAGFDVDDHEPETAGVSVDEGEDFTGSFNEVEEIESQEDEVIDLEIPEEESVLDLELEIEFDGDGDELPEPVADMSDSAENDIDLSGEDDDLDLDLAPDLDEKPPALAEPEIGLDSAETDELDLDVDVDLDLDVDLDVDVEPDLDLDVDVDVEPDLDLDLGGDLDSDAETSLELSDDEQEEDALIADGLDLPEADSDAGLEEDFVEDLALESNGFDPSVLEGFEAEEEPIQDETSDFLESGLDALEDMQTNVEIDMGGDDESAAAAYAPQRDLNTELEEAEFYIHQGLFDEAEGVCRALQEDFPGAPEIAAKLAEIAQQRDQTSSAPVEDDGDFFDLASELSNEGAFDAGGEMESLDERDLSRLDGILAEFKKGIEDQIDQEDTESHFNLGIAYKEMGLLDDAISEFARVMKDPQRLVDCLTLTGICHAEKGDFAKAEETFKLGLRAAEATDEDLLSLNYELGIICEASGRGAEAVGYFRIVAERQPNFRDVASKLEALDSGNDGGDNNSSGSGDSRISFV
ncbi:MAG: hypothetical protein C0624_06855 [Desulfuromonas sp.]|nr:MAG: hypothetical protein C0624_06855 [Desulfuromonas sp.]